MSDLLQFLWTAFWEYWRAWVTGTGAVGLLLFVFGVIERKRQRPVPWRAFIAVLFCIFWFLATFSAWHDSQKNLKAVIAQRAIDTSELGGCSSDLKIQEALKTAWQERYADQQKVLDALRAPQLEQQTTINRCVVSLGQMNPLINTKHTALYFPAPFYLSSDRIGSDRQRVFGVVILTNRTSNPVGVLKCDQPFTPRTAPELNAKGSIAVVTTALPTPINDREYEIRVSNSAGDWSPENPIHLFVMSKLEGLGNCAFRSE